MPLKLMPDRMETPVVKEVKTAANAQMLAPAGALPPLLAKSMAAPKPQWPVGVQGMPGVHQRAAPARFLQEQTQDHSFSHSVTQKMLQQGGFLDTGIKDHSLAAIPSGPAAYLGQNSWQYVVPQVPQNMKQRMPDEHLLPHSLEEKHSISTYSSHSLTNGVRKYKS